MRMTINHRKLCAAFLALIMLTASISVSAETRYMPDVTAAMSKPDYWVGKDSTPDEVLTSMEEIKKINQDIIHGEGTHVWDMTTWTQDTYDGNARNKELKDAAEADARSCYEDYGAKYKNGKEGSFEEIYTDMIANCWDDDAKASMSTGYAICTKRTDLRNFPCPDSLQDDKDDPDFDVQFLTAVSVGEPLVIQGKSTDDKYYHARTSYLSGWVSADDIAFCKNRQEWLSAWNFDGTNALVVYDDKIVTEDSNSTPETANRKLTMGVRLKIADRADWSGRISNRLAYNNYVVWMPVRNNDGSFKNQLALISEHCKVHEGYLPVTTRNLAGVMFNQLGNTYGWGGMLGSQDCSGYIRDVYRCFGIELARNTNYQAASPVRKFNLEGKTNEEKTAIIKDLPLGAELIFSGHAMLYLGNEGDKLYVISNVSNVVINGTKSKVRGAVINTLDVTRANGKSWLESLHTAEIPYYDQTEKSFEQAIITAPANVTWTGKAQTPKPLIKLEGKELKEGKHYNLSYTSNVNVGTATIKASGKGRYSGTLSTTFKILPKGTSIKKLKVGKRSVTVQWKKQAQKMSSARITGYQIQYATNSKFTKNAKKVKVKKYTRISKQIKGLKKNKKYYVRIRTYKTIKKKTYYSKWSKAKSLKAK